MENEIMNYEDNVMEQGIEAIDTEKAKSGIGAGKVLLIGVGVALATTVTVKLVKGLLAKRKAKKEQQRVDEDDLVEVTD